MRSFFSCVEKDFKLFGRSKIAAFITVFLPLLIVILISISFNSANLHGISVGSYSQEENQLTESILDSFSKQGYSVLKYGSIEDCENSVIKGDTQICVVFPKDFSEEGCEEFIDFYVDESRINLAYSLIEKIKSEISTKSSELSYDMVGEIVEALEETKNKLPEYKKNINDIENKMDSISKSSEEISSSSPDYSELISFLNQAENTVNGINESVSGVNQLKTEIENAISETQEIQEKNSLLSGSAEDISKESDELIKRLNSLESNIDSLINELNSIGVNKVEKIVNPIKTKINSISKDKTNIDFLLPTLLSLMIMFAGIILSSVLVIKEKKSRARLRNFISPTSNFTFISAMYFSALVILFFQFSVLLSGLIVIADIPLKHILLNLIIVLFLSSSLFILLGMFIGYIFRTEETGILVAVFIISLLIIFSNTILPIESISAGFQNIAFYNPLVLSSYLLKQVILFETGLSYIIKEIALISGFIIVFFFLAYIFRKGTKRFI